MSLVSGGEQCPFFFENWNISHLNLLFFYLFFFTDAQNVYKYSHYWLNQSVTELLKRSSVVFGEIIYDGCLFFVLEAVVLRPS